MAESWYNALMSLSGVLTLTGVFLTWIIQRKIEKVTGKNGSYSLLLPIGGIMIALGFAWSVVSGNTLNGWVLSLILIGPAIIGYALFEFGFEGVSGRLIIQGVLTLLSLFGAGHYSTVTVDVAYVGPFLAILLLMNAQILITQGSGRVLVVISSWLIVLFSWTRYMLGDTTGFVKAVIVAPYVLATIIWVVTLISLYLSISADCSPLHRTGQEGL